MFSLSDVRSLPFSRKEGEEADLAIYSAPQVPFVMKRVFVITAQKACQRGRHAHKVCQQLLVCLKGRCQVTIDDGEKRVIKHLQVPSEGLLIPPTLWAEQSYSKGSVLMVFADQLYDEADYIRCYSDFQAFRGLIAA